MRIEVRSSNPEKDGKGKSLDISTSDFKTIYTNCIEIYFSDTRTSGTGERGGTPITTEYHARLVLENADLTRIVNEAIQHKLLTFPGLHDKLAEARKLIDAVITTLK